MWSSRVKIGHLIPLGELKDLEDGLEIVSHASSRRGFHEDICRSRRARAGTGRTAACAGDCRRLPRRHSDDLRPIPPDVERVAVTPPEDDADVALIRISGSLLYVGPPVRADGAAERDNRAAERDVGHATAPAALLRQEGRLIRAPPRRPVERASKNPEFSVGKSEPTPILGGGY
ncbi:hypothetical protein DL765_002232 [Monosporascus sp. GIB2]|nr:hypothetical protein DL765_002232 [Monosporascus sp. GIB2]